MIIDELGYLSINKDVAKFFFQLIDRRYEKRSTIFPKNDNDNDELQPKPDCEMLYKELAKHDVTRTLLWEECAREFKAVGKMPIRYSQFCNYLNHYLEINKATMHFEHNHQKDGEWSDDCFRKGT